MENNAILTQHLSRGIALVESGFGTIDKGTPSQNDYKCMAISLMDQEEQHVAPSMTAYGVQLALQNDSNVTGVSSCVGYWLIYII